MLRIALLFVAALAFTACPGEPPTDPDAGVPTAKAPGITSIDPAQGSASGGDFVTIIGNDFVEGATVVFGEEGLGGAEASEVTVVGPRRITARTPAGTGTLDVIVVNPDGQSGVLDRGFRFIGELPGQIANAVLLGEASRHDTSGLAMIPQQVTAEVSIPGVTDAEGAGPGVKAQVGFVLLPADGAVSLEGFTWLDASFLEDGEGGADRYQGLIQLPGASGATTREYVYGARFSIDEGRTWTFADRDGSTNGFSADQLNRVIVSQPVVDWCKLGFEQIEPPPTLSYTAGQSATEKVYAQVYKEGVTDMGAPGPGLTVELGVGPSGSDPRSASEWSWTPAAYNSAFSGNMNNDEYLADLPNPGAGTYAFVYRVAVGSGPYTYCDADGSGGDPAFSLDQMGSLTVGTPTISSCILQSPHSVSTLPGATTPNLYGRVRIPGLTDGDNAAANVDAEVGFGAVGSQPDATWTWKSASFFADTDSKTTDEYVATISGVPAGSYDLAYRFRYSGGSWIACDTDGSSPSSAYETAKAGKLSVGAPVVTDCNLQWVEQPGNPGIAAGAVPSGEPVTAFGQVLVPGVTDSAGAGANLRAQFGVGTVGTDATTDTAWGWKDAAYYGEGVSGRDEFSADLRPAYNGNRAVSFRVSLDNGMTWSYCDQNGSSVNGYTADQQWALNVVDHTTIDFCRLEGPPTLSQSAAQTTSVTGRIYMVGVTEAAGAPMNVTAQLGRGPEVQDPGVSSAWTWSAAGFASQSGNDDLFTADFSAPAGSYHYAYRFSSNGGATWCYADLDGNGNDGATNPDWAGFSGRKGVDFNIGQATVTQ